MQWLLILLAGVSAGALNALAGGGSFITLGMLVLAGLDPRAANVTSTMALFPGQAASGYAGRDLVAGIQGLSFKTLFLVSLVGGVVGALLLLATPSTLFASLVPWLVLFATAVFFWGSFIRRPTEETRLGPIAAGTAQFAIAIYGGYFGGGIGFMMLAVLTVAGMAVKSASATKNALAVAMNASAVAIFALSRDVYWLHAAVLGAGGIAGGLGGAWLLPRINETLLRGGVVAIGIALAAAMFTRG